MPEDSDSDQNAKHSEPIPVAELIDRYHQLARQTQNPMYAWLAIGALLQDGMNPFLQWPPGQQLSLPDWIAEYLFSATQKLTRLSAGLDFRVDLPFPDFQPTSNDQSSWPDEYMKSPEFCSRVEASTISLREAMELVPAAFGLTRSGWNAFGSFQATTDKMQEAHAYEAMIAAGIPSKKAVHAIGSGIDVKDPSHVHARIREGQSLVGGKEVGKPED